MQKKRKTMKAIKIWQKWDLLALYIIFLSLVIFPFIRLREGLYAGVDDFIMPFVILFVIYRRRDYLRYKYGLFLLIFSAYILFTIAINGRLWSLRDYFEIYKMLKFLFLVLFARTLFEKYKKEFDIIVSISFVILLLMNLAHYFNLFGFNYYIEPYYATTEIHLSTFGLDSLGNPAVRRMIGTLGNPNDNAILFLFYFSYFLSRTVSFGINRNQIFMYLSFLCVVLTQSRTGFIAGLTVYIVWSILTHQSKKVSTINISCFIATFFIAFTFSPLSLDYYANTSPNLAKNNSVMGRIEMWEHLIGMIKHKPIFGYGPNKDYFYDNGLYPESEYVLYLWRYGIVGLFLYIGWIFLPIYKKFKELKNGIFYLLFAMVIGMNAITNCPLSSPKIHALFALTIGYFFATIKSEGTLE